MNIEVQSNVLADETGFLQWGIADEQEFIKFNFDAAAPSSMSRWPTPEEPNKKYKVVSAYIALTMD